MAAGAKQEVQDAFARHLGGIYLGQISSAESVEVASMGSGVWAELNDRASVYRSDFVDGFCLKTVHVILHMFLLSITPALALGNLASEQTHDSNQVTKFLLATGLAGAFFHMFGGQPLVILGLYIITCIFE